MATENQNAGINDEIEVKRDCEKSNMLLSSQSAFIIAPLPVQLPIPAHSGQRLHIEIVAPGITLIHTIVIAGIVW